MKYMLFPGCMVAHSFASYEIATRRVCKELGVELVDLDKFVCCGSSVLPGVTENWINLSAYTLAQAEMKGAAILTVCGNCANNFKRAVKILQDDRVLLERVNGRLLKLGMEYKGPIRVFHIIELFHSMKEGLQGHIKKKLDMDIALSLPCQVYRPGDVVEFDETEKPQSMRELLEMTGANVIEYELEYDCCGSTVMLSDEDMALKIGYDKITSARGAGAKALVVSCGNCAFSLDMHQGPMMAEQGDEGERLPILFLPQILGLAMGIPRKELKIKRHGGIFDE